MKNLFVLFSILIGLQAYSNPELTSDSLRKIVLEQLTIKETELMDDLWAEKVLPYAKSQTVMVIPNLTGEDKMEGSFELNAIVVVVNNQTGKILQQFPESNVYFSDAIYLAGFTIDTAPYLLTKEVRAFGVRAQFYGRSSANPYSEEQLSLFVQDGNSLRQVLKNEVVQSYSGEWNMQCNGEFYTTKCIILFESTVTKNYFNLVIKERYTKTVSKPVNDICEDEVVEKKEKKRVLHYNGTSYQ